MNGAVFQVSATTIARNEGSADPVHTICSPSRALTMPDGSNDHFHSTAATAVGIAHGTSTLARRMPRPLNARFMMSAIASPRRVSRMIVTAEIRYVKPVAAQNSLAPVPHNADV